MHAHAVVDGRAGLNIMIGRTVLEILFRADDGDAFDWTDNGALPAADADRLVVFVVPR
jgi:hypothetical protein